jgi:hypothetical protein
MSERKKVSDVIAVLETRIYASELQAAHAEEFIAEGASATPHVRSALDAAVHRGIAHGLRQAIDLLREELDH